MLLRCNNLVYPELIFLTDVTVCSCGISTHNTLAIFLPVLSAVISLFPSASELHNTLLQALFSGGRNSDGCHVDRLSIVFAQLLNSRISISQHCREILYLTNILCQQRHMHELWTKKKASGCRTI